MSKPNILVQLDVDQHASVFDAVVAVDAGVDHLLQYAGVQPDVVRDLVHGAIFTRGAKDLKHTAIFVGGSDVRQAAEVLQAVTSSFFGPLRVSVLFDANGANTTAAAAVLKAANHVPLAGTTAAVLGATGPVGQRAALLLARAGATVRVASRSQARAQSVCQEIANQTRGAKLSAHATAEHTDLMATIQGAQVLIAAGAAGIELVSARSWTDLSGLEVAIDLNAVPPVGIAPIQPTDHAAEHGTVVCYGALGVGGLKMKIHKAALRTLFQAPDKVLDAAEIYEIGQQA